MLASIIWHFALISSAFWLLKSKTLHVFGVYDVCAVLMTFIILYKTILLKSSFNDQQGRALVDCLQASIILQYNKGYKHLNLGLTFKVYYY